MVATIVFSLGKAMILWIRMDVQHLWITSFNRKRWRIIAVGTWSGSTSGDLTSTEPTQETLFSVLGYHWQPKLGYSKVIINNKC